MYLVVMAHVWTHDREQVELLPYSCCGSRSGSSLVPTQRYTSNSQTSTDSTSYTQPHKCQPRKHKVQWTNTHQDKQDIPTVWRYKPTDLQALFPLKPVGELTHVNLDHYRFVCIYTNYINTCTLKEPSLVHKLEIYENLENLFTFS